MIKKSEVLGYYYVMTDISNSRDRARAMTWCKENVKTQQAGEESCLNGYNRMWTYEPFINSTSFVFDREKDAFAFALKFA